MTSYFSSIVRYLKKFCEETTLHGLIHVVAPKRHWLERLLWISVLILSSYGSFWFVVTSWTRYATNPVIITLMKDNNGWKTTQPAITFCYKDSVDVAKAKTLVKSLWDVEEGSKFDYYMRFVTAVGNSRLETESLKKFAEFQDDTTLSNIDFVEMAINVTPAKRDTYSVAFGNIIVYPPRNFTIQEEGLCQSMMSVLSFTAFLHNYPNRQNGYQQQKLDERCTERDIDAGCFGSLLNMPRPFDAYLHAIDEIPDITSKRTYQNLDKRTEIDVVQEEVISASADIRNLWPSQRRCYFTEETVYEGIPFYSVNICRMQCRRSAIFKQCKCAPHFYPKIKQQRVCDSKGLACAAKHIDRILEETGKSGANHCYCQPTCTSSIYNFMKKEFEALGWFSKTKYLWRTEPGLTRYRRDIIFEFSDLLVSFGGTAALFLGFSVISAVELFYFFTIRFFRYMERKKEKKQAKRNLERQTNMTRQISTIIN